MLIRASSFVFALALGLASLSVQAIPVLWTLDGVIFDDGGTASGSFVYEADTNTFSTISITTTAGTTLGGASYSFDHPNFGSASQPVFLTGLSADLTGEMILALGGLTPPGMTNAGGTLLIADAPFSGHFEATCDDATCSAGFPPFRQTTGGSIIGIAVPEPGTLGLLGAGLLGLVFIRRRRVSLIHL